MKKLGLDKRERKFIAGVAAGKSDIQAAKDAGYSKSTAEKKAYSILKRPLVQSELTKALELCGVKLADIMLPIAKALKATRHFVHPKFGMQNTIFDDHQVQLNAADRAIKLLGGIPKVGESTPSAHGLNLFISVDQQTDRPKPTLASPGMKSRNLR
jgi:hypothetical protein